MKERYRSGGHNCFYSVKMDTVVNSDPARRLGDAGEVWKPIVGLPCITPKIPHM